MTVCRAYIKQEGSNPDWKFKCSVDKDSPRRVVLGPAETNLLLTMLHVMEKEGTHYVRIRTVNHREKKLINGKDVYPGDETSHEIDGKTFYFYHNRY